MLSSTTNNNLPALSAAKPTIPGYLARLVPGLCLCLLVTALSYILQGVEARVLGRAWLEALVLAILVGTAIRTAWTPSNRWLPGIQFSAKTLLELAVVMLGASISVQTIEAVGPALLIGIALVVFIAIGASYAVGRLLKLPQRMAILIACGNSICGNSAIAAVAPVIGADAEDIATSIAFTAVLGVIVVLTLPLTVPILALSLNQFGILAGLTVYAVPQVLAATAPISSTAAKIGTLVKLVRVLMLGPVVLALSVLASRLREETDEPAPHITAGDRPKQGRIALHQLVPWFIVGFLALAGLRSANLIPHTALAPVSTAANMLTIIAMAALGLGVDVRVVAKAGARVIATVTLSLIVLGVIGFGLIKLLGVA